MEAGPEKLSPSLARQQAERITAQAAQDAEKVLADAKGEAENIVTRGRTELELAARDAVGKLRDALGKALGAVLAGGVREKLDDEDFIGEALHEIITAYGQAELEGKKSIRINVPEPMRQKLVQWAIAHVGSDNLGGEHITIDLMGTLNQAGFEYTVAGATVEVTVDSVVEVLTDLVGPAVREILETAMAENKG